MKEEAVKKRGWVKNAAIIFLAVMLVLTFFSNTILNLSLPEVAAQHAASGTITAQIRGMGTVEANDSFEVILTQTRTVSEVNVRLGAEVEAGDLLFTLADTESEELESAQDALDTLLLTYERRVIEASLNGNYARENRNIQMAREELTRAQSELSEISYSPEEIAEARAAANSARSVVAYAQAEADSIQYEIDSAQNSVELATISVEAATFSVESARELAVPQRERADDAQRAVDEAQATVNSREEAVRTARNHLNDLGGADTGAILRQIENNIAETARTQLERDATWEAQKRNYLNFVRGAIEYFDENAFNNIPSVTDPEEEDTLMTWARQNPTRMAAYAQVLRLESTAPSAPLLAYDLITGLDSRIDDLSAEYAQLQRELGNILGGNTDEHNRRLRALRDAEAALSTANTALRNANAELSSANSALASAEAPLRTAEASLRNAEASRRTASTRLSHANMALRSANSALAAGERALGAAEEELAVQQGYRTEWQAANENVRNRQQALEELIFELSETQRADGVTDAVGELEMRTLRSQIDRTRDEIIRLEEDATGAVITSPVSGIVRQIDISPGQQTQSGRPIAVIEVADRGYSLSFPVTLEQSRRVVVGDAAEANRGWWGGGEIHATLRAIRNDPQNPATSRILDFEISGDIESGTQLNIALGERGQNFEIIVPNSALRSDANGDFVLVVLSRSTPLGNRFIATRADVNILATDDTNSAVAGGLLSWDFVITTATRPIEPGMQIRLVDN